ncbi:MULTISPECIES: hypothetical protein [unclassified Rhizobium]|jgi:hypothetical protein|uniref:hypothetical protein n=1 Tax=unclassified Rhizobium TaxID=2613769 RepID=UPI000645BA1C|nr:MULTISPECIES: hypothetical protein [unclassified Rhizobium]OJY72075.1 MAG: hypothetical protein BGP09_25370 [Rhizobium sp. 60-20]RKD36079.1 hypothetical protein BJ928_12557 [Rhizobium sp. WW_1]
MENDLFKYPQRSMTLPRGIWHILAGDPDQDGDNAIEIAASSPLSWPEFTSLSGDQIMLGKDGMFRLALWGASKCCTTLLVTRRATLLVSNENGGWEIQCRVVANASLTTHQPLSGFLLMPVEYLDRRTERRSQNLTRHADEIRSALLEAFPVGNDGENAP